MDIDFTSSGYIEVRYGDELVSRHRQEREAVEAVIKDSRVGEFTITYPRVKAVKRSKTLTGELQITGSLHGVA